MNRLSQVFGAGQLGPDEDEPAGSLIGLAKIAGRQGFFTLFQELLGRLLELRFPFRHHGFLRVP